MTPANPDHPSWGGKRKPRQGKKIGRPRLHPKGLSRFYINLSPDDLAWLDEHTGEMGTRASVVRRLIDEARQAEADPTAGPVGQINLLAGVLLDEFGGPVEGDGGAGSMAVRLLREQAAEIERLRRMLDWHEGAPSRKASAQ